jgi:hypothetical protein
MVTFQFALESNFNNRFNVTRFIFKMLDRRRRRSGAAYNLQSFVGSGPSLASKGPYPHCFAIVFTNSQK